MRPAPPSVLILAATAVLIASPAGARFKKNTANAGVFFKAPTWGVQSVDIDGDGDVDLLRNFHHFATKVQTNNGQGFFSLSAIPQLVDKTADRHGFLWADLNGDGILDAVCAHGGSGGCGCSDDGNELWTGLGGGAFELVTELGAFADPVGRGRCFSAADVDGDGDLDLHLGKAPLGASANSLFRNDGDMRFVDVAAELGLAEHRGTTGSLFVDYDDDGDADLLVGGEEFRRETILFRNDGGQFVDVTAQTLGPMPQISGADWGDYDNDGDMDLVVCGGHEGIFDAWGLDNDDKSLWFFANHRFRDDGIDVFQFDTPGDVPDAEIHVTGYFDRTRIFLGPNGVHPNEPDGAGEGNLESGRGGFALTDEYVGAPFFQPGRDHGIYIWRVEPGGTWAVFASAPAGTFGNFSGRITAPDGIENAYAYNLEKLSLSSFSAQVFRNDGGVFTEVTQSLGLTPFTNPRAVKWVDFDNDGDLDLHQMNKGTSETWNEPDVLWQNDGDVFTPVQRAESVPGLKNHLTDGGVWADFDQDGDLDLFLQEGAPPAYWANKAPPVYYRNEGPAGHWLAVTVTPELTGGTPVGTKVTAHAGDRQFHRRVEANSWRGFQGPLSLHFGLGDATVVESLVVESPSGEIATFGPILADQAIQVSVQGRLAFGFGSPQAGTGVSGVRLGSVSPQPARGLQNLSLSAPADTRLLVSIYDIQGRRIRTLLDGRHPGGTIELQWDGRDGNGVPLPSGVYFLRGSGPADFSQKLIRLR